MARFSVNYTFLMTSEQKKYLEDTSLAKNFHSLSSYVRKLIENDMKKSRIKSR